LLGTALQTESDPVWVADRTILGSVGSINTGGNLIDWSQLKGVPTAFSDGVDDGVTDLTSFDTDDLTEGAGNFYYTDARVGTYLTGSSVTQFTDVTNAGSGQIITGAERTLLGTALQTEADPVWVADRTTLGSVGTINTGGNLIDWSQLKGVPTDFSDGVDEGSTLVDGSIWVGNAGLPSAVTMSGDITLSNTGVATIAANAVDNTKIAATTITNSEISVTAAIAGAKITPDFGTQNIITSGNIQLTTSPTAGYVLTSDATGVGTWQPGSFALPYTNAVADINALFDLDNTGTGPAARFANTFTNGTAVLVAGNIAFEENLTRKIAIQDNLAAAGDDLEVAAGNSLFAGANGGVLNLRGGNATTGNGGNISLEPGTSAGTNGWIDMRGVARFGQVSATQSGRLEIEDNVGTGRVSINGAAVITSYNLSLPGANGTGALTNDGSGALTWNPAGAGNYIIDANENQKGGASAASATTTGAQNIVLGNLSASALTVGNGNIVAGYSGAVSLVGGSDNLVIGRLADVTGDGSNNVVLGDNADAAGSNSVVIGASASASGNLAIAIGENTQANGVRSMAFGAGTIATTAQTAIIGDGISNNTTFDVGIGTNAPTGRLGVATLVGEANKNGIVISQNAALGAGLIVDLTDVGNSNDAVIVDNAGSARAAVFRNTNVGNVASTLVVENAAAGSGLQVDKTTDGNAIEVNYSGTTTGSGLLVNMNLAGTDPAILVTNSSAAGSIVADGNISTSAAVNTNDLSVGGSSIHNGPFITPPPVTNQTVVASLPTPGSRIVRLVAGGTINAIGAGQNGQELILINAGPAVTVNDGATIFLNNNNTFNMSTTSTLHLIYDLGLGAWIEIGRSLNQ
ncbi:MAG: hypothetical protein RIF40_27760, partial [Imperialibacter sp.]|uniref:beta strand repeat-containing protein n=1 Tax=Imperialibacter sp. TaxID=2038411 RepID=UPI0032EAA116